MGDRVRPGTDDRHVALENVQELGQLVEAGAAHEPAEARDPGVVPGGLQDLIAVLADAHGTELIDDEGAAAQSAAPLTEHRPAPALNPNEERDQQQQGRENDKTHTGPGDIDHALQAVARQATGPFLQPHIRVDREVVGPSVRSDRRVMHRHVTHLRALHQMVLHLGASPISRIDPAQYASDHDPAVPPYPAPSHAVNATS